MRAWRPLALLAPIAAGTLACARASTVSTGAAAPAAPPQLGAIRAEDVRRDLFTLAADSFRGREAGTLDELRAAAWMAEAARKAGLQPAGDDGSYLQFWPMRRVRPAMDSRVALDGAPLALGHDVVPVNPVNATVDGPVTWIGDATGDDLARLDLHGKIVAATVLRPARPPVSWISLRDLRYSLASIGQRTQQLARAGAAAIVLVGDSTTDDAWEDAGTRYLRGRYNVDTTAAGDVPTGPVVLWVRPATAARLHTGARLTATLKAESFVYPSANVVAVVSGTDPALRGEYVLYSGHNDHDGVRYAVNGDSIWNGADDNASVNVGILAVGRAFARQPGRRSILFVFHGAEERGLLGSRWFVWHPTVPRDSIVAVLNGDMIGRNNPDTAALLGSQPPHRNSTDLVNDALLANQRVSHFVVDSSWDRPSHPEGWYFRSDHLPYARAGIPSIMFTTLLHPDYHTPRDEASRIDVAKLTRVAQWMYATGWIVAEAPRRPAEDPGFRLER